MAEKITMREKVGFSLGDGAANFIFQTMMLLQLSFYTDSFGISAAAAGWLPGGCAHWPSSGSLPGA